MLLYRQGNFALKIIWAILIFVLIHGQNNHSAWSVKIAFQSLKSQGFSFAPVGGNPDLDLDWIMCSRNVGKALHCNFYVVALLVFVVVTVFNKVILLYRRSTTVSLETYRPYSVFNKVRILNFKQFWEYAPSILSPFHLLEKSSSAPV